MPYLTKTKRTIIGAAILLVCMVVAAVVIFVSFNKNGIASKYFVRQPPDSRILFGSKTAYHSVGNYDTKVERPSGCRAIQLNMVTRHGTRNPSESDIKKFKDLSSTLNRLMKYNSSGQASTVKIQFPWISPYKTTESKKLVDTGDKECYGLGRRFAERFPELLNKEPIPMTKFKIVSSDTSRTTQSAIAFIMGYFQGKGKAGPYHMKAAPLKTIPDDKDTLLHYYDFCPKYIKEVADNKSIKYQEEKFVAGAQVNKTVMKVRKRLGLDGVSEVTAERVLAMHKACAFSIAVFSKTTRDEWCSLFDEEDFTVLNYVLDLDKYYEEGPVFEITYDISCVLLKDIFLSLEARAGRPVSYDKYDGHFRSGHSQTILPLYSLMGFFNNSTPLLAENFNKMIGRDFKSGNFVPFAGNIAFVLYECGNGDLKIQMYANERLVKLPCCKSKIDCLFSDFEKYYRNTVDRCDLKKMCNTTTT